jgi:hypothetical protein
MEGESAAPSRLPASATGILRSSIYAHGTGELPRLLDQLEAADGAADPVPSADGWELVQAENVAYLVDDQRRWQALAELRRRVGLAPEQILAAPGSVLAGIVVGRPASGTSTAPAPVRRAGDRPSAVACLSRHRRAGGRPH